MRQIVKKPGKNCATFHLEQLQNLRCDNICRGVCSRKIPLYKKLLLLMVYKANTFFMRNNSVSRNILHLPILISLPLDFFSSIFLLDVRSHVICILIVPLLWQSVCQGVVCTSELELNSCLRLRHIFLINMVMKHCTPRITSQLFSNNSLHSFNRTLKERKRLRPNSPHYRRLI